MSSSATNSPTKSGSYWTPRSPQQAKMANVLKETQPSADVVGDAVHKKQKLGKRISQSFKKLVTPRGSLRASTEDIPSYSTLSALEEASSNLSTSTDDYTIPVAHVTTTEASVVVQQEPSLSAVTVGDEIGAVDVAPVQPATSTGSLLPPRAPSQARMARPATSASNTAGSLVEGSSPSLSRPSLSRPSMSGPSPSAGSFSQRPNLSRPSLSRPSMSGRPNLGRPSLSRPSINSSASRAAESAAGAAGDAPAVAEPEVVQQVQEQQAVAAPAAAAAACAAEEVAAPASEVAAAAAPEPAAAEVEAPVAAQQSTAVVAAAQPRRAVRFLGALLRLTIMASAVLGAAALSGHPIDVPKKWDEVRKKLAGSSK